MSAKTGKAMFKNVLVSVSDKTGLVEFIGGLVKKTGGGVRVVSTGGTARVLQNAGIPVLELSRQTGFAEVMDGRVKSLHPHIYVPLLARLNNKEDDCVLKDLHLAPFDLVVCNLYPFEKKTQAGVKDPVEWIDVGGPSLLRAGAKNFERVTVLCDPADYVQVLAGDKAPDLEQRRYFSAKVFRLLSDYNAGIARWLEEGRGAVTPPVPAKEEGRGAVTAPPSLRSPAPAKEEERQGVFPLDGSKKELCIKGSFHQALRYGENPGQRAGWFKHEGMGLHRAVCLQGKPLSFNNICDLDSATAVVREFCTPCGVAVKHNNPCGVACADNIEMAIELSIKADPMSVFGAVIAVNRPVSEKSARLLCSLFLEAVIAPDYSPEALEFFGRKKKNLRVVRWPSMCDPGAGAGAGAGAGEEQELLFRFVEGGILAQEKPPITDKWDPHWQYVGKEPDSVIKQDLLTAWKVCAHLKSNAIALVANNQTVGLGMGQVNRVDAVEGAIKRWKSFHSQVKAPVLASDGFFPFSDSVALAARAGIRWIIQPGGSLRDDEVIAKAKELSVNMTITGQRRFAH